MNQESKKAPPIDSKAFYSRFETLKRKTDKPGTGAKLSTRLFFVFLLFLNTLWLVLALCAFLLFNVFSLLTFFYSSVAKKFVAKSFLNVKRSAACWIALLVAIFSPALGIMFSCLYFMMYDKMGIEEIVPPSLREQFKEFFY